ncbi:hypothetical protein BKA83DRAFT_4179638, partial [Pisolithus microcarpus]
RTTWWLCVLNTLAHLGQVILNRDVHCVDEMERAALKLNPCSCRDMYSEVHIERRCCLSIHQKPPITQSPYIPVRPIVASTPLQTPETFVDVLIIGVDPVELMYATVLPAAGVFSILLGSSCLCPR